MNAFGSSPNPKSIVCHALFQLVEVQVHDLSAFGVERAPLSPGQLPVAVAGQQCLLILGRDRHFLVPVDLRPRLERALRNQFAEVRA